MGNLRALKVKWAVSQLAMGLPMHVPIWEDWQPVRGASHGMPESWCLKEELEGENYGFS